MEKEYIYGENLHKKETYTKREYIWKHLQSQNICRKKIYLKKRFIQNRGLYREKTYIKRKFT